MMDGAINIQEDFRNQPVSHPEKKIEVEKILDRPERPKSEVFSGLLKEQIDRRATIKEALDRAMNEILGIMGHHLVIRMA